MKIKTSELGPAAMKAKRKRTRLVWRKGPPPSVGWWPASNSRSPSPIRWWDGSTWSCPCYKGDSPSIVDQMAARKSERSYSVEWRVRPQTWPAHARRYLK